MEQNNLHSISVEQCKKVTATAISSVDAFSPSQIVLAYENGKIAISGSNLKIINFSTPTGNFCATGTVTAIKYMAKGVSLRQKLFK